MGRKEKEGEEKEGEGGSGEGGHIRFYKVYVAITYGLGSVSIILLQLV